jgi:uncharacterized protein (TIGR02145 family)
MKTKSLLIILVLSLSVNSFCQYSTIELTFTSNKTLFTSKLDSIKIMNMTNDGLTTLYWPDTVLSLDCTNGISDHVNNRLVFKVFQNYPNPTKDITNIDIYVPKKGIVNIIISDVSGCNSVNKELVLERGLHSFSFRPGTEQVFFFTARWKNQIKSIKILAYGSRTNVTNSIEYHGILNNPQQFKRSDFPYTYGDSLLFIGFSKTNNEVVGSDVIGDTPLTNEIYEFNISEGVPCIETPIVDYAGQIYNTVKIQNQCWLKENLNIGSIIDSTLEMQDNEIIEKYCIKNSEDSCAKYGGLYQWNEMINYSVTNRARGICPPGWHIPSDGEWKTLEGNVDSEYGVGDPEWDNVGSRGSDVGHKLKSKKGWIQDGSGSDLYGFSARPSGSYDYNFSSFYGWKGFGFWWTSSCDQNSALYHGVHYLNSKSSRGFSDKQQGMSIRCIKD